MSYTQTNWYPGDTITASLLNKMEAGIQAGINENDIIIITDYNGQLNKNFQEIKELLADKKTIYINNAVNANSDYVKMYPIIGAYNYENQYRIYASVLKPTNRNVDGTNFSYIGLPGVRTYGTTSYSGYPSILVTIYPASICVEASTAIYD